MKRAFYVLFALGLVGAALLMALGLAVVDPLNGHGLHIVIDDRELDLSALGPAEVIAGAFGLVLAACIVALVVPLALLLGLALPLLLVLGAIALAGAALLGVGTLALAPLWLPLLLVIWLWRRSQRRARDDSDGATMAP
jgi:hypothetical protein